MVDHLKDNLTLQATIITPAIGVSITPQDIEPPGGSEQNGLLCPAAVLPDVSRIPPVTLPCLVC